LIEGDILVLTEKDLDYIYEQVKPTPQRYHHICYAGNCYKKIDTWSNEIIFKCPDKGIHSWMTPVCEKCDGLLKGDFELSQYQEWEDMGMQKLLKAIKEKLKDSNKCTCWKCMGLSEDPYAEDEE
jgi:hypothetical protein